MRFIWIAIETMEGREPKDSDVEHFAFPEGQQKEMIKEMEKRIEKGYHLFKQDIMKDWTYISELFFHPSSIPKIPALRKKLIDEYNNNLIKEYKDLTGNQLEKKL